MGMHGGAAAVIYSTKVTRYRRQPVLMGCKDWQGPHACGLGLQLAPKQISPALLGGIDGDPMHAALACMQLVFNQFSSALQGGLTGTPCGPGSQLVSNQLRSHALPLLSAAQRRGQPASGQRCTEIAASEGRLGRTQRPGSSQQGWID